MLEYLCVCGGCLQTLAKVICMVLRFTDEETKAILERQASNS